MGIRVSTYVHEEDGRSVPIKWLKPSDILRFLLERYPSLLLGGLEPGAESEAMLSSFWEQYRFNHGSHAVFAANDPLHRTIPLSLHGDGARTQKNSLWMWSPWKLFWGLKASSAPSVIVMNVIALQNEGSSMANMGILWCNVSTTRTTATCHGS